MEQPPALVTVRRMIGVGSYVATCGRHLGYSSVAGPEAAKSAGSKALGCEPDQVILQKHAPGVFRATKHEPTPT